MIVVVHAVTVFVSSDDNDLFCVSGSASSTAQMHQTINELWWKGEVETSTTTVDVARGGTTTAETEHEEANPLDLATLRHPLSLISAAGFPKYSNYTVC